VIDDRRWLGMADEISVGGHHLRTLERIYRHPVGHNIEWHDVLSLLETVGTVVEEHNGRLKVDIGSESETFDRPKTHDTIDAQQVVDLRRMLERAGITPEGSGR
jgi:hypothetical protein